ncbi:hypothetical protein ACFL08_05440 [Patescibacteria group bacterium]
MDERMIELWKREVGRVLKPDQDYFIITDGESVLGSQYQILGSVFAFSEYSTALMEAEKLEVKVEKVSVDDLIERYAGKFDFIELDPDFSDDDSDDDSGEDASGDAIDDSIDESKCSGQNVDLNRIIELFDSRLSEKLIQIDERMAQIEEDIPRISAEYVEKAFLGVKKKLASMLKKQAKSQKDFDVSLEKMRQEFESNLNDYLAESTLGIKESVKKGVSEYFSQKRVRGSGKGIQF